MAWRELYGRFRLVAHLIQVIRTMTADTIVSRLMKIELIVDDQHRLLVDSSFNLLSIISIKGVTISYATIGILLRLLANSNLLSFFLLWWC